MTKFKETEIGKIPEDWAVRELGEIAGFQYGLGERAKETGEYVYLRITDITSDGFLNKTGLTFIGKDRVKKEWILKKNDVLVARTGASFGKTYLFDKEFKATYGGFLIRLLFKENIIDSNFFFQFSRSSLYWNQANNLVNGGAQPQFNANTISKLLVPCPPLHEQHAISKILSNLDAKIELNREMNATLESMAEALFKHWFVDFEFPDENGKPYKSSGGRMIESELGEIPEGWAIKRIDDVAEVMIGRTPPRKEAEWFTTEAIDVCWVSIKDMGKSGMFIFDTSEYLKQGAIQKFRIPIIPEGTVMLSFKLTVGRIGIASKAMASNEAIAQFQLKDSLISSKYLYFYLKNFNFESLGSTSSIATATNSDAIRDMHILVPNKKLVMVFERKVNEVIERIRGNLLECRTLSDIRDSLLPRLMSGKIRVPLNVVDKT